MNAPSNLYFAYDAFGRKVRGEVQNSSAWMFYDGENTVRFRDHEFLHWPELDAPLIAFFASGSNITCNDAYTSAYVVTVGNRLLDYHSSGTGMSCFGNTSGEYQAWTSVGRHAGAIRDSETFNLERSPGGGSGTGALSFFRNRWYDANTGRFTQEDPIGFAGGLNLYAYAGNNPASYTDPFGLCPWCLGGIGGVVTGFALAKLTGADYDFKDAATDFALGAAGAGIVSKLDKINDARKAATVAKNTLHGAQRLKQAGFTDDLIQLTKGGRNFKQADGANVFLRESSPGRFDFIVESERGVVTAHRNWSQKSIERIARNYGWEW